MDFPDPLGCPGRAVGLQEVRFAGPLAAVAPMKVPTELPVDLVHPVELLEGSEAAAFVEGAGAIGAARRLGQGRLLYLGCRLRDDQSGSTGQDVRTLTEVLETLGAFGRSDAPELVSRRGPFLVNRFANGAYSMAPHYREIVERWDGGFFRDAARDEKALEGRTLPPVELDVKDLQVDGHRVSGKGIGCISWRMDAGGAGLVAFAGTGTTGIEVDGRKFALTGQPARIGFAPVVAERLPAGFARGFHVLLDQEEARLPLGIRDSAKVQVFRDAFGDGRRLEPVTIGLEARDGAVAVKIPGPLRGASLILLEP